MDTRACRSSPSPPPPSCDLPPPPPMPAHDQLQSTRQRIESESSLTFSNGVSPIIRLAGQETLAAGDQSGNKLHLFNFVQCLLLNVS